jgi:hypothetical protein
MMMGVGLLFMMVIGLVVIGVPILIVALIAGGGLGNISKQTSSGSQAQAASTAISYRPVRELDCPACGRSVQADWKICPSCGTALP